MLRWRPSFGHTQDRKPNIWFYRIMSQLSHRNVLGVYSLDSSSLYPCVFVAGPAKQTRLFFVVLFVSRKFLHLRQTLCPLQLTHHEYSGERLNSHRSSSSGLEGNAYCAGIPVDDTHFPPTQWSSMDDIMWWPGGRLFTNSLLALWRSMPSHPISNCCR